MMNVLKRHGFLRFMNITAFHAKYFAYELTRRRRGEDEGRLSQSLFDSSVDLNPHQIEAALVISQLWAERKRRIVVVCPAALRKQWANELAEKFHLPAQVVDGRTFKKA